MADRQITDLLAQLAGKPRYSNIEIPLDVLQNARNEMQQQKAQQAAASAPSRDDTRSQHETLIKQLMDEQTQLELSLLGKYDSITERIKLKENEICSDEILGRDFHANASMLADLHSEQQRYAKHMYMEIENLRKKQQHLLQRADVPFFKVSDDPDVLANQIWTLTPYVHRASVTQ
jgi:hypothetical protein